MNTKPHIDLGLSVLCAVAEKNAELSYADIAEVCDCSSFAISGIGRKALDKLSKNKQLQQYYSDTQDVSLCPN